MCNPRILSSLLTVAVIVCMMAAFIVYKKEGEDKTIETENIFLPVEKGSFLDFGSSSIKEKSLLSLAKEEKREEESPVFLYNFNVDGVLFESGSMDESRSAYWWLDSGAQLLIKSGIGFTLQGELPADSSWRIYYDSSNPEDTDGGYHPQNIFRLFTKRQWTDFREEAYFMVNKVNLSESPNRDGHNGILLLSRYKNENNLYYAGLRVDGSAVIKKKVYGEYYDLAIEQVFQGAYDRKNNPNLIPLVTWIGIRSEIKNNPSGAVSIKLFIDVGRTGQWEKVLDALDDRKNTGSAVVAGEGHAGIRTDFLDVSFADFKVENPF